MTLVQRWRSSLRQGRGASGPGPSGHRKRFGHLSGWCWETLPFDFTPRRHQHSSLWKFTVPPREPGNPWLVTGQFLTWDVPGRQQRNKRRPALLSWREERGGGEGVQKEETGAIDNMLPTWANGYSLVIFCLGPGRGRLGASEPASRVSRLGVSPPRPGRT